MFNQSPALACWGQQSPTGRLARRATVRRWRGPKTEIQKSLLLDDLDLSGRHDHLAVLLLDVAGGLHLLDIRADVLVESLRNFVLFEVVGDLLATFVNDHRVLTRRGFL